MSGFSGRSFTFSLDGVTISGVQSRTFTPGKSYPDISTLYEDGYKRTLDTAAEKQISISIDGVMQDEVLLRQFLSADETVALVGTLPVATGTASTVTGTFKINSFDVNGSHDGAVMFSLSVTSEGVYTYNNNSGAWILATGSWNDAGFWQDTATWDDGV